MNPIVHIRKGKERKVKRLNAQLKSRLNQLSLQHETKRDAKKREKKPMSQLSPEMVIESVRAVQKGERDYSGKDLWKRYVLSLKWMKEGVIHGKNGDDDGDDELM